MDLIHESRGFPRELINEVGFKDQWQDDLLTAFRAIRLQFQIGQ